MLGQWSHLPKGALVTEVSMTLSGASATGWSQTVTDDRDDWFEGTSSATDARSGDLSLGLSPTDQRLSSHTATMNSKTRHPMPGSTMVRTLFVNRTLPIRQKADSLNRL